MLSKLLKYEFKSTARILVPLYIIAIVFSVLCRSFNELAKSMEILQTPGVFLYILYTLLIVAVVIITLVVILQRFEKNLMGDEGYLMFTLPVESHTQILTKLLTALVWTLSSIIVALSTLFILIYSPELWKDFKDLLAMVPAEIWKTVRLSAIIVVFQAVASILMIYTAISLGQLVTGHKVIGSIAAYFGLYIINQIIMMIVMGIIGLFHQENIGLLMYDSTYLASSGMMTQLVIVTGILYVVLCTAYFFTINYIFKNKLNLE